MNQQTELDAATRRQLNKEGFMLCRQTEQGGIIGLSSFLFTTGLMGGISADPHQTPYQKRYCYPDRQRAIDALAMWDGVSEPLPGWTKYKGIDGERTPCHA